MKKHNIVAYINMPQHPCHSEFQHAQNVIELFCAKNGWSFDTIIDNSLNPLWYRGIEKIIDGILSKQISKLIFLNYGTISFDTKRILDILCKKYEVEMIFINKSNSPFYSQIGEHLDAVNRISKFLFNSNQHKEIEQIVRKANKLLSAYSIE